jgi:hypothetical protein
MIDSRQLRSSSAFRSSSTHREPFDFCFNRPRYGLALWPPVAAVFRLPLPAILIAGLRSSFSGFNASACFFGVCCCEAFARAVWRSTLASSFEVFIDDDAFASGAGVVFSNISAPECPGFARTSLASSCAIAQRLIPAITTVTSKQDLIMAPLKYRKTAL